MNKQKQLPSTGYLVTPAQCSMILGSFDRIITELLAVSEILENLPKLEAVED